MTDAAFGSFFLADPSKFPSVVEGEPWGEVERQIDLPGGPFVVRCLSPSQARIFDASLTSSAAAHSRSRFPAQHTTVLRADPSSFRSFDIEGWVYTFDIESTPESFRLAGLDFFALVPWDQSSVAGLWTSVEDQMFQGVIENYLRVLVAHRLLRENGLLLHSAGVVIDGLAYLFVGASNAGKSTLAAKAAAAGSPVLSDDLNAVLDADDQPSVMHLPFTGEIGAPSIVQGFVRLGGIFLLEKGDCVGFSPLSRGEAVAAILSTAPFVNRGEATSDALFETAVHLAEHVPTARMTSAVGSSFDEIAAGLRGFH